MIFSAWATCLALVKCRPVKNAQDRTGSASAKNQPRRRRARPGEIPMSKRIVHSLLLVAASFLGSSTLAQDVTGNVVGTVQDSSGSVITGATVTVTNSDTNVARKVITGDAGRYVVPFLPIGHYSITVEKGGFGKATINGIALNAHDELTENATLQIGATQAEVTVSA